MTVPTMLELQCSASGICFDHVLAADSIAICARVAMRLGGVQCMHKQGSKVPSGAPLTLLQQPVTRLRLRN